MAPITEFEFYLPKSPRGGVRLSDGSRYRAVPVLEERNIGGKTRMVAVGGSIKVSNAAHMSELWDKHGLRGLPKKTGAQKRPTFGAAPAVVKTVTTEPASADAGDSSDAPETWDCAEHKKSYTTKSGYDKHRASVVHED